MLWSAEHPLKAKFVIDDNLQPSSKVTDSNAEHTLHNDGISIPLKEKTGVFACHYPVRDEMQ